MKFESVDGRKFNVPDNDIGKFMQMAKDEGLKLKDTNDQDEKEQEPKLLFKGSNGKKYAVPETRMNAFLKDVENEGFKVVEWRKRDDLGVAGEMKREAEVKKDLRKGPKIGFNEMAGLNYEATTGADAPENAVAKHIANTGSIFARGFANGQMRAAQALMDGSDRDDDETDRQVSQMLYGDIGGTVASWFSKPEVMEDWDETVGKKIKDPEERRKQRNQYAAEMGMQLVKDRTHTQQDAQTDIATRDRTWGAQTVADVEQSFGYMMPMWLGPVGIAAQFVANAAGTAEEYANDTYDFDEDGNLVKTATGDNAVKAGFKGTIKAGIETGVELIGGKVAEKVAKGILKGAGRKIERLTIGKFPIVAKKGAEIMATPIGQKVAEVTAKLNRLARFASEKLHIDGIAGEYAEEWLDPTISTALGVEAKGEEQKDGWGGRMLDTQKEFFTWENQKRLLSTVILLQGAGVVIAKAVQKGNEVTVNRWIKENGLMTEEEIKAATPEMKAKKIEEYVNSLPEEEITKKLAEVAEWADNVTGAIKTNFNAPATDGRSVGENAVKFMERIWNGAIKPTANYDIEGLEVAGEGRIDGKSEGTGETDTRPVIVLEKNDGTKELITGKKRVAAAKEKGEKGIDAIVIREKDGWTSEAARHLNTFENLHQGGMSLADALRAVHELGIRSDVELELLGIDDEIAERAARIYRNAGKAVRAKIAAGEDIEQILETGMLERITWKRAGVYLERLQQIVLDKIAGKMGKAEARHIIEKLIREDVDPYDAKAVDDAIAEGRKEAAEGAITDVEPVETEDGSFKTMGEMEAEQKGGETQQAETGESGGKDTLVYEGALGADQNKGVQLKDDGTGTKSCARFPQVKVRVVKGQILVEGLDKSWMTRPENLEDVAALLKEIGNLRRRIDPYGWKGVKINTGSEETDNCIKEIAEVIRTEGEKAYSKEKQQLRTTVLNRLFKSTGIRAYADAESWEWVLKQNGVKAWSNEAEGTYGCYYNGEVYLNPTSFRAGAAIHEYGHVTLAIIRKMRPDIYRRGLELVKEDPLGRAMLAKIQADKVYGQQDLETQLEEVITHLIETKGEALVENLGFGEKLKAWLKEVWAAFREAAGVTDLSEEDVQNMTLDRFADTVLAQMMKGERIGGNSRYSIEAMDVQKAGSILAPKDASHQAESPTLPSDARSIANNDSQVNGTKFSRSGLFTGSAADYEKPSLLKVGTGEGSQVYGWGLYASNRRGVAESYAKMTGNHGYLGVEPKNRKVLEGELRKLLKDKGVDDEYVMESVAGSVYEPDARNIALANIEEAGFNENTDLWKKTSELYNKYTDREYIYEQTFFTNRAPGDESHLLNWYEPISEENKQRVIAALKTAITDKFGLKKYSGFNTDDVAKIVGEAKSGQDLYERVSTCLMFTEEGDSSQKAASEFLARADIDGIKYPVDSYGKTVKDGDLAGWNYVSFRDDNIRVDHKWRDGKMLFGRAIGPSALGDGKQKYYEVPFEKAVDKIVKNGKPFGNEHVYVSKTPKAFEDIGMVKLPIMMTQHHVLTICNDAKSLAKLGIAGNAHDMKAVLKQIPKAIEHPLMVIASQTDPANSVIAITALKDKYGKTVIVPVEMDGVSPAGTGFIDSHIAKSAFGKSNAWSKLVADALADEAAGNVAIFYMDKTKANMIKYQLAHAGGFGNAGLQLPRGPNAANVIHSITDAGSPVNGAIADQTQTRQFKEWFGKSKVVDANGRPLVLYHGSPDYGFTKFDTRYRPIFLTENKDAANLYTRKDDGSQTYALYAKSENLLTVEGDHSGYENVKVPKELEKRVKELHEDYYDHQNEYEFAGRSTTDLIAQAAFENGYDGVRFRNIHESYGEKDFVEHDEYAIKDANQVKSATDNIGTFDPANKNIMFGRRVGVGEDKYVEVDEESERLAREYANGNDAAGEKLYARHGLEQYYKAKQPNFSEEDIEDAEALAWKEILKNLRNGALNKVSFGQVLFRQAELAGYKIFKEQNRHKATTLDAQLSEDSETTGKDLIRAKADTYRQIYEILERFDPKTREMLEMKATGKTVEEIAEHYGISQGKVKEWLMDAYFYIKSGRDPASTKLAISHKADSTKSAQVLDLQQEDPGQQQYYAEKEKNNSGSEVNLISRENEKTKWSPRAPKQFVVIRPVL